MDHRAVLDHLSQLDLLDKNLPTIDPKNPYALSQEEEDLMNQLARSFRKSEKMQRHLRLLYEHGSLYLVRNGFLLYHAAIPLNADGSFTEAEVCGKRVSGKALMDRTDEVIRQAYYGTGKAKQDALDYMLYLWEGERNLNRKVLQVTVRLIAHACYVSITAPTGAGRYVHHKRKRIARSIGSRLRGVDSAIITHTKSYSSHGAKGSRHILIQVTVRVTRVRRTGQVLRSRQPADKQRGKKN